MAANPRLILLELNEINFEMLGEYASEGCLPTLQRLLRNHGFCRTTSESEYENLEPWIQWVTAHTGLTLDEHGVFRLGDIVNKDLDQVWERLERDHGVRTGAISPMNAQNRAKKPAFFIPDPWTNTEAIAPTAANRLFQAIRQLVNDNASGKMTPRSAIDLALGMARFARPSNYPRYAKLIGTSTQNSWRKPILLDLLLADLFIHQLKATEPGFASLFLNAGAHIQHHYLFNSARYDGDQRNPEWYIHPAKDPVLEVYQAYDQIVCDIQKQFPQARIMLATGLHQKPHPKTTFYWRLKAHEDFLRKIKVPFLHVEPRMSRDFLIQCSGVKQALEAEQLLRTACAEDGLPLFETDNRGDSLFVMFSYPQDISADLKWSVGEVRFPNLKESVAFVAVKNGEHDGVGYFLDTGLNAAEIPTEFPLTELSDRIVQAAA